MPTSASAVFPADASRRFAGFGGPGLSVVSRRSLLKVGLGGIGGLSLPALLEQRAAGGAAGGDAKSVILLWMTGGPSHIDTWDPKPDAPVEIRSPFAPIATALPGTFICEHLPGQAAILDRFTVLRGVDSAMSNHQPNQVFQTGNPRAETRTNPEADKYPAIASAVAKFRGANQPDMPPYVAFTSDRTHIAWGGYLGMQYDPLVGAAGYLPHDKPFDSFQQYVAGYAPGATITDKFVLPGGLTQDRLYQRVGLRRDLDRMRAGLDQSGTMEALGHFGRQAVEMVLGERAAVAFDLSREPEAIHQRYGTHPWCQQALLARRLVEHGVSFVTLSLSPYNSSGAWDNHAEGMVYGGIEHGLKPLLPAFDHTLSTLVLDLEQRGLLDQTLVIAMGEFGRTPKIEQGGRNHWQPVMSMCLAGGGLRHGQVIGGSDRIGGEIHSRRVSPGDLAATIYRHMGVPLDATYPDHQGRPRYFVEDGQPIEELF
jgi:hypothetical protein